MKGSKRVREITAILLQALKNEKLSMENYNLAEDLNLGERSGDMIDRAAREKAAVEKITAFQRRQEKINNLQLALWRVKEDGGMCADCGEEIPLKRIESYPTSDLCVGCQSLKEEKEKGRK